MRERWLVRLLVDRDPDVDAPPDQWEWPDAAVMLPAEMVGVVAPDPPRTPPAPRIIVKGRP